jgi:hypothetical protein
MDRRARRGLDAIERYSEPLACRGGRSIGPALANEAVVELVRACRPPFPSSQRRSDRGSCSPRKQKATGRQLPVGGRILVPRGSHCCCSQTTVRPAAGARNPV